MTVDGVSDDFWLITSGGVCRCAVPTQLERFAEVSRNFRPTRRRSQIGWFLCMAACRSRIAPYFLERSSEPARIGDWDWRGWLRQLEATLGHQRLLPAFYYPPQLTRSRSGVLLLSESGAPVAYAKLNWDEDGALQLQREANAVEVIQKSAPKTFRTPTILDSSVWKGRSYSLFSVLPKNAQPAPTVWSPIHRGVLDELSAGAGQITLSSCSWWLRANELSPPWKKICKFIADNEPSGGYLMGRTHGDFTPWNMKCTRNSVWLFDWENSLQEAPYAEDFLHFVLSQNVRLAKQSPQSAVIDAHSIALSQGIEINELALALIYWKTVRAVGWTPSQLDEMAETLS